MSDCRYIIMCGGKYRQWETPRQLLKINGEAIINRTIRLLRENDITDIAISTDNPLFECCGVPLLKHNNTYDANGYNDFTGYWCDAFYPTKEPVCYIFGDVVFSPEAMRPTSSARSGLTTATCMAPTSIRSCPGRLPLSCSRQTSATSTCLWPTAQEMSFRTAR